MRRYQSHGHNQVYKSKEHELVLTVVGDPISDERLETLHPKQVSYGIQSVQLESQSGFIIRQELDSDTTKGIFMKSCLQVY